MKLCASSQYFFESIFSELGVWMKEFGLPISFTSFEDDEAMIFWASVLIIFALTSIHLPLGASGIVTTHTISNLLSLCNSCKNGTAIGAHEKKTTL